MQTRLSLSCGIAILKAAFCVSQLASGCFGERRTPGAKHIIVFYAH
jgi:hypothetical protein